MNYEQKQRRTEKILTSVLNWVPLIVAVSTTITIAACTPGRIQPYGTWISRLWCVARITTAVSVGFALGAGIAWIFAKIVDIVEDRMDVCFGILSYTVQNTAAVLWGIALIALVPTAAWWISSCVL